jgi:fatty acid desaturase
MAAPSRQPAATPGEPVRASELPPDLLRISPWRGAFDTARTWIAVAVVALVCRRLAHPLAWAAGAILVAGLQNNLMVLWHHSIHHNMHPLRRVNDWIGRWLLISPMGQPFGLMRRAHIDHHAHLGRPQDPDRWYYDLDLHGRRRSGILLGWLALNCLGGLVVPQVRKAFTGRRDRAADPGTARAQRDRADRLAVVVAQGVLFGAFWVLCGAWWGYFVLWALPAVTLGGGLNCLRTALEHADPSDPPHRDFSFRSNALERFFVAPFHMNYHWEHHLLMTVPYYQMPSLRRLLLERGRYGDGRLVGSYLGRLREITRHLRETRGRAA